MTIQSDYIVKCKGNESMLVRNYFNDSNSVFWKYVLIKAGSVRDYFDSENLAEEFKLPIITFEEWENLPDHEAQLSKETLPTKWVIRQDTDQSVCDWFNKQIYVETGKTEMGARIDGSYKYLVFGGSESSYANYIPQNYTEITFDQFKEFVLKEPSAPKPINETEHPEVRDIIGYKLIAEQYKPAVGEILKANTWGRWFEKQFDKNLEEIGYHFGTGFVENIFRNAGVLDVWFTPVYTDEIKEEKTYTFSGGLSLTESDVEKLRKLINND